MTIDQLSYFYEVARCLNFSQAARNLYISQPNLTKYIAGLEKELGFRLFDRSTHHCQLTEAGQAFLRNTEDLFCQLNHHIERAKIQAQNPYQLILIGAARDEIPPRPFVRHLNEKNTDANNRYLIQEESYLNLIDKLRSHELDLIVTTDKNVREINDFDHLTLRPFHMLMAVHNSNPKAKMKNLLPRDCVDDILFICVPEGKNAPLNRLDEISWKTGAHANLGIVYSTADVMLNVQIGAGIGIIPSTVDLTRYYDISYYVFEPQQNAEQVLAWRRDETRPEVLSLIDETREMAPFRQPPEVPIYGLTDVVESRPDLI